MSDTWTPIETATDFADDSFHEIDISTKQIAALTDQPIIAGEHRSQFIKFQMARYYDNIDLTTMDVNVIYQAPDGYSDIDETVNKEYNDNYIRFGWLVPYQACPEAGTLAFALEFVGSDYVLKTQTSETKVLDSLDGSTGVPEPSEQSWYITLQTQVATAVETANSTLATVMEYVDVFQGNVEESINNWLESHPEATTTIEDSAVTTAKIADGAVTAAKIADSAVGTGNIIDSAITSAKIADTAVTAGKIAGGSVTEAKLDTQLYKAYLRTETAMHFFPSLASGGYSGNSSMMIANGKCVLFDCAPTNNWDAVKAYYDALYANGIFTNIDYIIISHYHYDHIGNVDQILERYPHDGCVVYLPLDPTGYITGQDSVLTNRTAVIDTLESYELEYHEVSADTEIDIAGELCKVSLFNSTAADYAYYQETCPDVYNNYSMCALVKTGEVYALYPGDIQREAQIRILATKSLPKLVLYSTHHHAIQNDDFLPYLDAIEPEYSVIQTNHTRGLESAASSFASNYASHNVYSCGYASCVIAIGKDGGSVLEGVDLQKCGWAYSYVDLYVDNTYTGVVHDGTETHPYVSINEAIMFVKDNLNLHYRIRVKATSETYEYTWIRDTKTSIEIIGQTNGQLTHPIVDGIYLKNSNDVTLNNINITGAGREVNSVNTLLYVLSSFVFVNNCVFNDSDSIFATGIQINNGTVYFTACEFFKITNALSTYRWGTAISNGNTFNNCTTPYLANNLNLYIRNIDTVSNCTNYIYVSGVGAKPVTFPSLTSAANVTALSALVALNSGRVLSRPFDCNGRMAVVRDSSIVYRDSLADTGTTITSNTNLNSLTAFGKYYCGNSSTAQSLSNCPTSIGFTLFVERNASTYTRQTIYDNEANMFIRTLTSGGTWNAWKTVTLT